MTIYSRLLISASVALCATSAMAEDYFLQAFGGANSIIVWKSSDAQSEGMQLIQAGVHKTNPAMVMKLVSCIEKPGTRVIITDMGFVTHDIMVIDGKDQGCRGNIAAEELGRGVPASGSSTGRQ
ncbi:hypothetical protein [Mesorhizobium sp. 8]|uniref:hypothetical protein n=1 Tax=Mesorhizobium sp. 8 TaxID=2584466 RepID=UPI001122B086|nr:hypothetical protein [Mesorhizobium sp. 8]QDC00380.1 hypothetical protein FGU64_08095 [Mesorhizobium sp. 8]